MMELTTELGAIVEALDTAKIPYAVCGGIAVTLHGYTRFTQDIDLLIRPEHLDGALAAVAPLGYVLEGGNIPLGYGEPSARDLFRISKAQERDLMTLDLLIVNPLIEPVWSSRIEFAWEGRVLTVVSLEGLAVLKRLAGRPQDLLDLDKLGVSREPDTPPPR